ncbi:unnamed protein product, partial [Arabidopsis halleri]
MLQQKNYSTKIYSHSQIIYILKSTVKNLKLQPEP